MYRLVLYYLTVLLLAALAFSFFGILQDSTVAILFSTTFILAVCWVTNELCARFFKAPTNIESVYITAFILALIIQPVSPTSLALLALPFFASVVAMVSKYIFAFRKKHFFNPAALGVVVTALAFGGYASWWVATPVLLPLVVVGGLLVLRKIRRLDLFASFAIVSLVTITLTTPSSSFFGPAWLTLAHSPFFFFGLVMLTEPLTTPPTRWGRYIYGAIVGILFAPALHIGTLGSSPELALVAGNIFSFAISPKGRFTLTLKNIEQKSSNVFEFVFGSDVPITFKAGQYLEWTLPHAPSDTRGNRRYFTIASAPEEKDIRLGLKFYEPSSTFKKALRNLPLGETLTATALAGEFVMPKDTEIKLAFLAGGIGVTPFRSMVEHLHLAKEKRDIALLYSNKTPEEISYAELFDRAREEIGMKTVYPSLIDRSLIETEIPDFKERVFYVSGPEVMVDGMTKILIEMHIPRRQIKRDFFPGLA